jgi:hypothetical protein
MINALNLLLTAIGMCARGVPALTRRTATKPQRRDLPVAVIRVSFPENFTLRSDRFLLLVQYNSYALRMCHFDRSR